MENFTEQVTSEIEIKNDNLDTKTTNEKISGGETKPSEKDQKKKGTSKKKTIIGIGVAAIIAIIAVVVVIIAIIIIIICISMHRPTINLNDYITIDVSGYDGYGKASYELDTDKLFKENKNKFKVNKRVLEECNPKDLGISLNGSDMDEYGIVLFFAATGLNGTFSEEEGLSNGDTVIFSWYSSLKTDEEIAEIAKKMRVKLKYSDIEYTVDNLREVSTFDPFEGVELSFSGMEPNGKAVIANYPDNGLYYYIDGEGEGLKNGDEVTVKIEYPYGAEEYINDNQKKPGNETKSYMVEGLGEYLTSASQIPDEYLEEMKVQAKDVILGTTHGWVEGYTLDINYIGNYFLIAKQNTKEVQNMMVLVYKMHYENSFKDYAGVVQSVSHDYYFYVNWDNLYFDGDGEFKYTKDEYYKTTNKYTCEWDIYQDYYKATDYYAKQVKLSFIGYPSLDEIYDLYITGHIEDYKFEDNIAE